MLARPLLGALALAALACALAPTARAAPSLTWSDASTLLKGASATAVSCAFESLCVAVDKQGQVLTSTEPTAAQPWQVALETGGASLTAVSCAPGGPCVAVDDDGDAFVDAEPGVSSWSGPFDIDGSTALTGVSCASASLCAAVDASGDALTSSDPASPSPQWQSTAVDDGHDLESVSCPSASLCVAVDSAGDTVSSTDPTGGSGAWHTQRIDFERPRAVSCASTSLCVAVDAAGQALASSDPASTSATWSVTPVDPGDALAGVSCATSGLCAAVGAGGEALASDNAAATTPDWTGADVDESRPLTGVACLTGGLCLAVDADGAARSAHVPAPGATTTAPVEVTSSSATLSGVVEPNDATLEACAFEYGATTAYGQTVPCVLTPSATGGRQQVTAQITGLAADAPYHYRLTARSPRGARSGADEAFNTAISSAIALIVPNPSISGTPAVGQKLTCHANTPSNPEVRLGYTWLRDQIPIPGSEASTYTVKGQDSGYHLQCQVTATDGGGSVTKKSAFVTIPAGGAPTSAGETTVGGASFEGGKLSVPIDCSPHASGGCQVALRLTAVETLSGGRVVAVAARAARRAHGRASAVTHMTVTLASLRAHLPAGADRTLTAALTAAAKHLLAVRKRFSAYVYVTGTVIGVIEAQLAQQLITIAASGRDASHAALGTRIRAGSQPPPAGGGVLAETPYMGWDTYFALGGEYSEATILEQASELKTLGLEKLGYRYVWLDVGWWHGTRAPDGEITVSATQWPHGMAWLARTLHAAGFRVGLYTDAGPDGCGGAGQGSYGHYQQDANTFAAWGFDAVKVDFCGGAEHHLNPAVAYSEFHEAIEHNSSHRPMLLSICDFLQPEQYGEGRPLLDESAFSSYTFGPSVGNSWRTDTDVGLPGEVSFADVLRNMDADAAAPQAAGPGHWNDPDYLAPDQGMSATQFQSQLSMWAMLAAPLMISANLQEVDSASLEALRNTEAIAIDQDPAGVQGTLLSASGNGEVWVKPLVGGARAVALLNRGSSPVTIETSAAAAGLPQASSYSVRNVWTHTTSTSSGTIAAEVGGDATVLLRVTPR